MADFKAKVKQIIDEGFTKEQIKPDINRIKKGYYKSDPKPEKKETFEIDISMKGLKGRIQSKDQGPNASISITNPLDKYRTKGATKPMNNEIEIRELPITATVIAKTTSVTATASSTIIPKGQRSTKQSLYRDIIASLDANKVRNGYKSKVKREIEAFSNTLKETSFNSRNSLNKQPLPSIPNATELNSNSHSNKKASLTSHQSFNLINHKINSLLNKTNALTNPANKKAFESNESNKSRSSLWTKVTSINLDADNQKDVDEFSKSFDLKASSSSSAKETGRLGNKMDSLFKYHTRKQSEDNLRAKLQFDF